MEMFKDIYPAMSVTNFHDNYPERLKRQEIDVSLDWLERRLGKRIPNDTVANKMERLGFDVKFDGDNMRITAPTWRSTGDVSIPDDIIEEIARIHGFENFEPTPIHAILEGPINQLDVDIDRKIREYLAFRCGMQEVYTYPWISDEYINAILSGSEGMFALTAPPSPHEKYIRTSLLPNLCKAVADNQRFYNEFAIFESAQVFFDRDYTAAYDPREKLPLQRKHVAGAFVGDHENLDLIFRKAKGAIETLPRYVHIEPFTLKKGDKPVWADDVICLGINNESAQIGTLALLSKKAALDCGIRNSAVMIFEIDLDSLKPYQSRTNKFTSIPEYPMTDYDMSLLFDLTVTWEEIYDVITSKKGPDSLLRDVSFLEDYKGKQVPKGKKSIAFRLLIGSLKKTLTSEEIEGCANAVVKRLKKTLGAETREM
jgi:phenylalanyl-tRNA synthetase beta chain